MRLDADIERVALRLYEGLGTPIALKAKILLEHGEWDQLAHLRVDPTSYIDNLWGADRFRRDYQACEFLRKYVGLPVSVDRRDVAVESFWAAEAQCKLTNDRLDRFITNTTLEWPRDERILDFIEDVKRLIARVLGPVPLDPPGKFGKGAVFESKGARRNFVLGDKMALTPHATPECKLLAELLVFGGNTAWGRALLKEYPYRSAVKVVPGNRFTTVPKDATKDRGICIEPGANVFLQLALGRAIRSRLKRNAKIDLDEGQDLHRRKAMEGSRSGDLATIDLSSASDTVARKLVQLLLPQDWYEVLDALRSPKTLIRRGKRDVWVWLEKFSSMGNGFTFELETLLFYAIAKTASKGDATLVYGDDIIVRTARYNDVIAALRFFGFTPNPRKSFSTGAFRESCGGDFFLGEAVRPYYLKGEVREPADWISLANGLWRASGYGERLEPYRRARLSALRNLPAPHRRCVGPDALGDIVIHDYPWRWTGKTKWQQRWFKVYRPVHRRIPLHVFPGEIQLALALYGVPSTGLVPRSGDGDRVSGHRFGWARYS